MRMQRTVDRAEQVDAATSELEAEVERIVSACRETVGHRVPGRQIARGRALVATSLGAARER
jgi:DUF971 family protein